MKFFFLGGGEGAKRTVKPTYNWQNLLTKSQFIVVPWLEMVHYIPGPWLMIVTCTYPSTSLICVKKKPENYERWGWWRNILHTRRTLNKVTKEIILLFNGNYVDS